jgi:hypothetical protein
MKNLLTIFALSISLCAYGQSDEQPAMVTQDTASRPGHAIGIHMGYFMSIGASYQHFFNNWISVDLNAGYRWINGLSGQGINTRIGAFGLVQAHVLSFELNAFTLSFYPAAGLYAAQANYNYPDKPGGTAGEEFFVAGFTAGAGADLRIGRVSISGMWLPGRDLTQDKETSDGWFRNRCSGVSLRYVLAR